MDIGCATDSSAQASTGSSFLAACIKGGLELQGYAVGAPLPPQAPLFPEGIEEVRRALFAIGAL